LFPWIQTKFQPPPIPSNISRREKWEYQVDRFYQRLVMQPLVRLYMKIPQHCLVRLYTF
jgi:hypothetical protein